MNILVLAEIEASGEIIALQEFIRGLRKRNKEANFFLVAYGKNDVLLDPKLFKEIITIESVLPPPPFKYYRQMLFEVFSGCITIKKMLRKASFDYVVITDYRLMFPAKLLMPFLKTIYIVQGFRYRFHQNRIKRDMNEINFNMYLFLRKIIERSAYLLANIIVVPSEFTKKEVLIESYGLIDKSKIFVVHNPVRCEFYHRYPRRNTDRFFKIHKLPKNKKIIVFSGLISPRKKIIELIRAFKRFSIGRNDFILVIAHLSVKCDLRYKEEIFKSLNPKIYILEDLNSKDLSILFQSSFLGVYPTDFETYGNVFKEALISGLPVLSTRTGLIADMDKVFCKDLLLPGNSERLIYKSFVRFVSDPKLYQRIKRKDIASMREYFDKHTSDIFFQLFEKKI